MQPKMGKMDIDYQVSFVFLPSCFTILFYLHDSFVQPAPHGLQQQSAADDSSAYVPAASVIAEPHQIKWQPPANGRFKCNIDAAPVLVFVFGTTKGLLFLPKLCMEALPVRSWDVV
jgi:hypothetical protein